MEYKIQISSPLWLLFILAGFTQFSETVYSPALPNIAETLHTSNHIVQWTLSIYFIGFALGVFIWGRLSDYIGRRPTMLMGISIYIIGSLSCLLASNIVWLLLARLIQGLGASSGSVITQTIARESLEDKKRHRFFSAAGFAIALFIALGPFVGGYLTQWFSWRANFALLVIIGIMLITLVGLKLPETHCKKTTQKKKIIEVFFMLIKDKHVLGCVCLVAIVDGMLFSYYAEAPFIFIQFQHLTESQYGWLSTAIALAALLGSLSSMHLAKALSSSKLLAIGCLMMLMGSMLLLVASLSGLITANHPLAAVVLIVLPMMGIVFGGFGFIIPLTLSTALQKYQNVLGTAGALFGLSYYILIALLTWIMGLIHNGKIFPMPIYFFVLSLISCIVFLLLIKGHHAQPVA